MTKFSQPTNTIQEGISIEDAQYMICQGTYGGKLRAPSERQAACQRYEELSGHPAPFPALDATLVILTLVIISSFIYLYVKKWKMRKNKSTSRQKVRS
jgi:hypothetical protein